jgi:hypothetical protein
MTRFVLAMLAYVVPTFVLGFVWHLILFLIETAFTIAQWAIVAPLTVLAFRQPMAMRARSGLS